MTNQIISKGSTILRDTGGWTLTYLPQLSFGKDFIRFDWSNDGKLRSNFKMWEVHEFLNVIKKI